MMRSEENKAQRGTEAVPSRQSQQVSPVKIHVLNLQRSSALATKLHDQLMTRLHPVPQEKGPGAAGASWYVHVDVPEAAELVLEVNEHGVHFRRREDIFEPMAHIDEPTIKPEDIDAIFPGIMQHVALFNYYLALGNPATDHISSPDIDVHFYSLEPSSSPHEFMVPGKEIAFQSGSTELLSKEDALYAFVLRNNTNRALFPHVLFFDPATYAVQVFYKPTLGRPPLGAGSKLQLGSSMECTPAVSFMPQQARTRDCGFWKVMVTEEPIDVHSMKLGPALGNDKTGELNYFFLEQDEKGIDGTPHVSIKSTDYCFLRRIVALHE